MFVVLSDCNLSAVGAGADDVDAGRQARPSAACAVGEDAAVNACARKIVDRGLVGCGALDK